MPYAIGYVDNAGSEGLAHWQMLLKIKTFAEANGWITLRYLNPTDGSNRELILQGAGLSGTEQIFIGFRSYHNVGADYYNLSTAGFTGYVAGNSFATQPGYIESGVPAHNQRIDYWLVVNAQRIAFALKAGTPVYESGYTGKFMPYATPGQYPYPMVVGGMLDGVPATRFSDTSHSLYAKGNRANLRLRFTDGVWSKPEAWPWNNTVLAGTGVSDTQLRDTSGTWSLLPVVLNDSAKNVYGELDGIYFVSGFNNTVENTLIIGGVTYVVIQDVGRTGFSDYYAMRIN